jgi:hypothetical protein
MLARSHLHGRAALGRSRWLFTLSLVALLDLGAGVVQLYGADPASLPAIVYVDRRFSQALEPLVRERSAAFDSAQVGRLMLRHPDGRVEPLVDGQRDAAAPIDVADPALSYDAKKVVFAGFSRSENAWRIYEFELESRLWRQVTRSDRSIDLSRFGAAAAALQSYDDADPVYLGDGRIVFVSTRYPGFAPDLRQRSTNLYSVRADGGDLRRITSERFGADTPAVDPTTGNIVYSRWWRSAPTSSPQAPGAPEEPKPVPPGSPGYGDFQPPPSDPTMSRVILDGVPLEEFPGLNNWFLASIHPDGDGLTMLSGVGLDRRGTQAYRPSFLGDGRMVAFFLPTTPFVGRPGNFGLRVFDRGAKSPLEVAGPQNFFNSDGQEVIDAAGNVFGRPLPPMQASPFLYNSAEPLDDGSVLVSAARNGPTLDYGLYVQSLQPGSEPVLVHDARGVSDLDAVPVIPRAAPPAVADRFPQRMDDYVPHSIDEAFSRNGKFKFVCENIFFNPPVDAPLPNSLPVGKRLFIEFYMNPQRSSQSGADEPFLVARQEIGVDGKVEMELPGGVPLFEVIRRSDDRVALGRDGQIFHVGGHNFGVTGSTGRCVGCHAGHTMVTVPEDASWTNVAPSAVLNANSTLQGQHAPDGFRFFDVLNLVDRKTDAQRSVWASADALSRAEVTLRWSVPITARNVVLYGVRSGIDASTTLLVRQVELSTYLQGSLQNVYQSGTVSPDGTAVALRQDRPFDTLRLEIRREDLVGVFLSRQSLAALAEVVVEGKASESSTPGSLFVRGDVNCDGNLNITDAVVLLNHLFLGGPSLCCAAAGDADDSGRLNLTDPVRVLDYLFRFSMPLPAPFPECGQVPEQNLSCDQDTCFTSGVR